MFFFFFFFNWTFFFQESGYCQTKYVAEQLCVRALSIIPLTIVRPALIGWARAPPSIPNASDWLTSLMFSSLKVNAVPKSKQRFTVLPVDECAAGIVKPLELDPKEKVIHLAHTQSFRYKQLFEALRRASNLSLPALPFSDWISKLRAASNGPNAPKSLSAALLILGSMTDLPVDRVHSVVAAENLGIARSASLGDSYLDAAALYVLKEAK